MKVGSPAVLEYFWYRTDRSCEDGSSASEGFNHHQAKRFGPVDRKSESERITQEFALLVLSDFAYVLNEATIHMGFDVCVIPIATRLTFDLRCDLERDARFLGDLHGPLGAFFGTDSAQKS